MDVDGGEGVLLSLNVSNKFDNIVELKPVAQSKTGCDSFGKSDGDTTVDECTTDAIKTDANKDTLAQIITWRKCGFVRHT